MKPTPTHSHHHTGLLRGGAVVLSTILAATAVSLSGCSTNSTEHSANKADQGNPILKTLIQPAQAQNLNLSQNGRGRLFIQPNRSRTLSNVTVNVRDNGDAELSLRDAQGRLLTLQGRQINRTNNRLDIQVTGSGNADANGIVALTYGTNNNSTIQSVTGDGRLDGQTFRLDFSPTGATLPNDPGTTPPDTTPAIRQTAVGQGFLQISGDRTRRIRSVAVQEQGGEVNLAFRLGNNQVVRFTGDLLSQDPNNVAVTLRNYQNADSTGRMNVSFGANQQILAINGNGTLDGQNFSLQFNQGVPTSPPPVTPPIVNGLW